MPRLTRRKLDRRHRRHTAAVHVHVFDRQVVDPDYLGVGAVLPACACGATA